MSAVPEVLDGAGERTTDWVVTPREAEDVDGELEVIGYTVTNRAGDVRWQVSRELAPQSQDVRLAGAEHFLRIANGEDGPELSVVAADGTVSDGHEMREVRDENGELTRVVITDGPGTVGWHFDGGGASLSAELRLTGQEGQELDAHLAVTDMRIRARRVPVSDAAPTGRSAELVGDYRWLAASYEVEWTVDEEGNEGFVLTDRALTGDVLRFRTDGVDAMLVSADRNRNPRSDYMRGAREERFSARAPEAGPGNRLDTVDPRDPDSEIVLEAEAPAQGESTEVGASDAQLSEVRAPDAPPSSPAETSDAATREAPGRDTDSDVDSDAEVDAELAALTADVATREAAGRDTDSDVDSDAEVDAELAALTADVATREAPGRDTDSDVDSDAEVDAELAALAAQPASVPREGGTIRPETDRVPTGGANGADVATTERLIADYRRQMGRQGVPLSSLHQWARELRSAAYDGLLRDAQEALRSHPEARRTGAGAVQRRLHRHRAARWRARGGAPLGSADRVRFPAAVDVTGVPAARRAADHGRSAGRGGPYVGSPR